MKITRKHFIKSPLLAVGENYIPSLADCFFYTLQEIPFKIELIVFKRHLKSLLSIEFILFPCWLLGTLIGLIFIVFYPLIVAVNVFGLYVISTSKLGRKYQKNKYNSYTATQIANYKRRIGWNEL